MPKESIARLRKINPLLEKLDVLEGDWDVEASSMSFRENKSGKENGHTSFKWLKNGAFMKEYSEFPDSEFPTATWVIGIDDTNKTYSALYNDSRGVSRVYEMSFNNKVWKIWRDAPGFSQRFTGKFSDDGNTITAKWEQSKDGATWHHDFDLVYKKMK